MIVEGMDEVIAALAHKRVTVGVDSSRTLDKVAGHVEGSAKEIVTVRTGATRDSIETTGSGLVREIGPTTRYGFFLENGTFKDAPQPFMGPALDKHTDELIAELTDVAGDLF